MADEILGAVDGIDDPPHVLAAARAELLAEEAVVGIVVRKDADDRLLGFAVRLRDGRVVGLQRDIEAGTVVLERDLPRRPRGFHRDLEGELVRHGAGASSPGNGSPRSPSTLA